MGPTWPSDSPSILKPGASPHQSEKLTLSQWTKQHLLDSKAIRKHLAHGLAAVMWLNFISNDNAWNKKIIFKDCFAPQQLVSHTGTVKNNLELVWLGNKGPLANPNCTPITATVCACTTEERQLRHTPGRRCSRGNHTVIKPQRPGQMRKVFPHGKLQSSELILPLTFKMAGLNRALGIIGPSQHVLAVLNERARKTQQGSLAQAIGRHALLHHTKDIVHHILWPQGSWNAVTQIKLWTLVRETCRRREPPHSTAHKLVIDLDYWVAVADSQHGEYVKKAKLEQLYLACSGHESERLGQRSFVLIIYPLPGSESIFEGDSTR